MTEFGIGTHAQNAPQLINRWL